MPSPQQILEHLAQQENHAYEECETPGVDAPGSDMPGVDTPGPDMQGPDVSSPDKTTSIIAGFGILFLILLISTMYTVAPMFAGTGQNAGVQNAGAIPTLSDNGDSPGITLPKTTVTTAITPVIISSVPVNTSGIISSTTVPTPAVPTSYVTIEAVPVPSPPTLQDITQDMPFPSTKDYFTIYSMNNQDAVTTLPYISFALVNPPLVIEYDVTPLNITDVKDVDYKILKTVYHETFTIDRFYEQSWFRVIARDRDTGKVVAENGYGILNGQETHGKIAIYKGGNYRFEFSGQFTRVSLTMKVKKEGNIESG
jgi:hypothetical protein